MRVAWRVALCGSTRSLRRLGSVPEAGQWDLPALLAPKSQDDSSRASPAVGDTARCRLHPRTAETKPGASMLHVEGDQTRGETLKTGPRVREELAIRQGQKHEHQTQLQLSVPTFSLWANPVPGSGCAGAGTSAEAGAASEGMLARAGRPRGRRLRGVESPAGPRGLRAAASRGRPRPSIGASRPPAPSPVSRAPSRSPPSASACRWGRPSCRSPSRKAAPLPCRQLPAPSSRGAQGQESASGGRREGPMAALRRPRAGGPAAPPQAPASGTIAARVRAGRRAPCTAASSRHEVRRRPGTPLRPPASHPDALRRPSGNPAAQPPPSLGSPGSLALLCLWSLGHGCP